MAKGFYFDMSRCIGCRACQVACNDKNRFEVGTLLREVKTFTVGSFPKVTSYSYSFGCNHCENPICLHNCPVGAIYKAEDGTVIQDSSLCIGCQMCVLSCPYHHPKFMEEQGVATKCDGCYGLRAEGGQPACVAGCPNRALDFGDIEELEAKYGTGLDKGTIVVLPDASITEPHVLVKTKEQAFEANFKELNW